MLEELDVLVAALAEVLVPEDLVETEDLVALEPDLLVALTPLRVTPIASARLLYVLLPELVVRFLLP